MKIALLIFQEKHGDRTIPCENDTALTLNLYKVFEERLNDGWYSDENYEEALSIVENKKNGGMAIWVANLWSFMDRTSHGEYENYHVDVCEMKTFSNDLVDFIPKRYKVF